MDEGERWNEAARQYGDSTSESAINQAAGELKAFLKSLEGAAAMNLLKATRRVVFLASNNDNGWGFGGNGLRHYSNYNNVMREEELKPLDAIVMAFRPWDIWKPWDIDENKCSDVLPGAFMLWLRRRLDEVATEVERRLAGG